MKGTITCMWCGHRFDFEHLDPEGLMTVTACPHCKGLLEVSVVKYLYVSEHRTTEYVETKAIKEKVGD